MAPFAQDGRVFVVDGVEGATRFAGKGDPDRRESHAEARGSIDLRQSLDRLAKHLIVGIRVDLQPRVPHSLGRGDTQVVPGVVLSVVRCPRAQMTCIGLRSRAPVCLAAAVQGFLCLVRRFLRLRTVSTQQMRDALRYPEDDSDGMRGDLLEGLDVILDSA